MPRPSVLSPFAAGALAALAYISAKLSVWAAWPFAAGALLASIYNHHVTGAGVTGIVAAIAKLLQRLRE